LGSNLRFGVGPFDHVRLGYPLFAFRYRYRIDPRYFRPDTGARIEHGNKYDENKERNPLVLTIKYLIVLFFQFFAYEKSSSERVTHIMTASIQDRGFPLASVVITGKNEGDAIEKCIGSVPPM
jgi:hypothetical protein